MSRALLGILVIPFFLWNAQITARVVDDNVFKEKNMTSIDSLIIEDTCVYQVVERMPQFPGCSEKEEFNQKQCADRKLLQYIYKNLKYPNLPKAKAVGDIESFTLLSFVVEKDGSISQIKAITRSGQPSITNAAALLCEMPNWIPGSQNGKLKRVEMKIPLRICYR